jgi:hypothetical protein
LAFPSQNFVRSSTVKMEAAISSIKLVPTQIFCVNVTHRGLSYSYQIFLFSFVLLM